MRMRFIILFIFLSACVKAQFIPYAPALPKLTFPANTAPFILIDGQSNALGEDSSQHYPPYIAIPATIARDSIWQSSTSNFQIYASTSTSNNGAPVFAYGGTGAEALASVLLLRDYNTPIYIGKNAYPNLYIASWSKSADGFRWDSLASMVPRMFAHFAAIGKTPKPLCYYWDQGENDYFMTYPGYYYDSLVILMANVRALDPSFTTMPIIMLTMNQLQNYPTGDPSGLNRMKINSAIYQMVYNDPIHTWALNSDFYGPVQFLPTDGIHYLAQWQLNWGSLIEQMINTPPKFNVSTIASENYINAVNATGYIMSTEERGAVRDFINGLQQDGIWQVDSCIWAFTGNLQNGAIINMKNPGVHNLVPNGSWTYDSLMGAKGDNSTTFFQTGITPSTYFSNSSLHIGIWSDSITNHSSYDVGSYDGTHRIGEGFSVSSGSSGAFLDGAATPVTMTQAVGQCDFSYDGTTVKGYVNGIPTVSSAKSPAGLPTTEMFAGGFNNNGGTIPGSHRYSIIDIGGYLTPQQEMQKFKLTQVYFESINRFRML